MRTDSHRVRFAKLAAIGLIVSAPSAAASPPDLPILDFLPHIRIELALKNLDHGLGPLVVERTALEQEIEKLRAEGPEALPILAKELPGLSGISASMAADLLGEACYKPALPALLSALESEWPPSLRARVLGFNSKEHVQHALLSIAERDAVPQIVEKLFDPKTKKSREFLIRLLAKIDTPEAYSALQRFYGRDPSPQRRWWSPPDPTPYLKSTSCEGVLLAAARAQATLETIPCSPGSVIVPRPEGGALVVFGDRFLGGNADLWAAEVNAAGISPAVFLGAPGLHRTGDTAFSGHLDAWFDGPFLEARWSELPQAVLRIEPGKAGLDTDGDTLPDLVEERLHLDPRQADTDGDGLADAEDATPNGRVRPLRSDAEEIAWAILRHVYPTTITPDGESRPPILQADLDVDWPAGHPLNPHDDHQGSVAEIAQILRLSLRRDRGNLAELAPGEIRYELSSGTTGYRLIVRRYRDLWVVVQFEFAWIA